MYISLSLLFVLICEYRGCIVSAIGLYYRTRNYRRYNGGRADPRITDFTYANNPIMIVT
jgi:hypothetical protein